MNKHLLDMIATEEKTEIKAKGKLACGSRYSRVISPINETSPEHLVAEAAKQQGYRDGEEVTYKIIVERKY